MEENQISLEQETEVIKALKEEYEAKIAEQRNSYETQLNTMRTEHAKQLREILKTGEAPKAEQQPEEQEEDEITAAVNRICAKYKK